MKVAKVVATCFLPKKFINKSYLVGDPLGFFGHSQKSDNDIDIINLIKFNIEKEKESSPGADRDLIIVNSDVNSLKGNKFIKKINGMKIPGGMVRAFTRKNIGRSFGSYNDAFLRYGNKYDFFLFTEDDMIITTDNYLKIGLDIWRKQKKCGFIAYIHTTKIGQWHWEPLGLNQKTALSCHGACGLVSSKILKKISKKHGCLPHNKGTFREADITHGEVAFPNSILRLGYKLIDLPKDLNLAIPAYDLMRGIKYKKWPNIFEFFFFLFKSNIYKLFSKNEFTLKIYLRSIKFFK